MNRFKLLIVALAALFVGNLREQFCTANMDQGLKTSPNQASFLRFTTKAIWIPTGSIHGVDLGNILMQNSNYGTETEKVPYAVDGNNVIAKEEAIMMSPVWTLKGNQ